MARSAKAAGEAWRTSRAGVYRAAGWGDDVPEED